MTHLEYFLSFLSQSLSILIVIHALPNALTVTVGRISSCRDPLQNNLFVPTFTLTHSGTSFNV